MGRKHVFVQVIFFVLAACNTLASSHFCFIARKRAEQVLQGREHGRTILLRGLRESLLLLYLKRRLDAIYEVQV